MNKKEVANVLEEIAVLLELSGENPFKARSYENVARALEQHEEDIETLVREKRLREVKGVGEALEDKVTELVTTGRLEYYETLKAKFPETLFELFNIPGLGAKRIKTVYEELQVHTLNGLERACKDGRVAALKGFGAKTQEKMLEGIAFARKRQGLFRVDVASAEAAHLRDWVAGVKGIRRVEVAGSLRRRKEVVKDIDLVASSEDPGALMDRFVAYEGVETVTGHGETKSSVVLKTGLAADLRVVSDEQFPYALHHFTGSKEHNVAMRQRAKDRGLKMNEYGLFRGEANVPCRDEAAIFHELGLPWIPPELREDMGELELAEVPRLLERGDLAGLIHCHSTYSDGRATLKQMAEAAEQRGYAYMAIADHSQTAVYASGLRPETVLKQHREIDALNKASKTFRILKCIESDILMDGALDYDEDLLRQFDLVIASVHSRLTMSENEATERIVKAVENPYCRILGHPTGRLLLMREGYSLNYDKVMDACVANRVAIEINANPNRLDIDWRHIRRGRDRGVLFSIGPDAHEIGGIDDVDYGVGIARKGWLGPEHILNCMDADALLAWCRG